MSFLFFLDESGSDHRDSPYEVLAGIAIHDSQLWDLIEEIRAEELRVFGGVRYGGGPRELKARRLLDRQTFRLAAQMQISTSDRGRLAASALTDGAHAGREELTALGQAKIGFCHKILDLCEARGVHFFASIVLPSAPRSGASALRKDYSYLFQRFFYFLEQEAAHERGVLVMDELERSQAYLLTDQMAVYFRDTKFGKARARRIIPEPLFAHSELTTGVQIADLVAYVLSWNVRLPGMGKPARKELDSLGKKLGSHQKTYRVPGLTYPCSSFTFLRDLRTKSERDLDSREGQMMQQLKVRIRR